LQLLPICYVVTQTIILFVLQDIEWAKDGVTGELFIVQARPETVRSAQKANVLKQTQETGHGEPVMTGSAIGSDAASGVVRVVRYWI
jgi:pyruvate,water dikinase